MVLRHGNPRNWEKLEKLGMCLALQNSLEMLFHFMFHLNTGMRKTLVWLVPYDTKREAVPVPLAPTAEVLRKCEAHISAQGTWEE